MSFDYNYKFWVATQKDLDDILKRQDVYRQLHPIEDPEEVHLLFADLYARYVQLVNKLGYIYHHTFQVQKREVIKNLLEAATQRVLELKNELKNLELSEFIYIDKTLIQRKLVPDDIMVWTPKYFPFWRPTKVSEMINGPRKNLEEIPEKDPETLAAEARKQRVSAALEGRNHRLSYAKGAPVAPTKKPDVYKLVMGKLVKIEDIDPVKKRLMDAVILIQSHERARVARFISRDYKPHPRDDEKVVRYKFTHKSTQPMLFPVKRTHFEADYFIHRKDLKEFQYYVKPVHLTVSVLLEDEPSDVEEESEVSFGESGMEMESDGGEGSDLSDFDGESTSSAGAVVEHSKEVQNLAAQRIQAFWRGYRDRKVYKALLARKLQIYGMAQEFRPKSRKVELYEERMKEAVRHRMIKEKYDEEFIQFCQDERARILRVRGPWIMEDISDHIREWFREFYVKAQAFHPYPDIAKGGTLLLLKGDTMTIGEFISKMKAGKDEKAERQKAKEKAKLLRKKERDNAKKKAKEVAKRRALYKAQGIFDIADNFSLCKTIAVIEKTIAKYKTEWENIDEKLNKNFAPIKEWITSDYYAEIHVELQQTVDELMRIEFELLQRALAQDKGKKYKPQKNKHKPKKRRGKKPPFDMTSDRSIESLYYEMQDAGIVRKFTKKTIDYFIGDRNMCAYELMHLEMKDAVPFKGEIRDVLMEYVLGMGPLNIPKPKGVLLVGPTHSGKQLLCDILATEIDAVVLDISPEISVKYQDNLKYFLHIIVKMAKILQPTIIFIRDVHRVFFKKVPKDAEALNPRLLQPVLKKTIFKQFKKDDKVFLLGTTDAPWAANGKMKSLFPKIILVPKSEYSTAFMLRRDATLATPAIPRDFNFSALALVTRDYSTGDLVKNVQSTLDVRRRMKLVKRPLQPMEFLDNFLVRHPPHFPPEIKEWEKFAKWYRRVSKMARQRAKFMKLQEIRRARQPKPKKKKGEQT